MARKKLTPIQMGFIALLWVFFWFFFCLLIRNNWTYNCFYYYIGIIVFIPIYKSFRKQ